MFNMNSVGRKIAQLRKSKNLTQSELADMLSVTYQAVSNWERGDTMPDIAKLGELSKIFDVSIDELLENHRSVKIVKDIIDKKDIDLNYVDSEELKDVLPLIKPNQFDESFNNVGNSSWEMIVTLAPFLDDNILKQIVLDKLKEDNDEKIDIVSVAPFLSSQSLSEIIDNIDFSKHSFEIVVDLAPFLDDASLKKIALDKLKENNEDFDLVDLAPFLSNESLNEIIDAMGDEKHFDTIVDLAPFLDSDKIDKILYQIYQTKGLEDAIELVPFATNKIIEAIAKDLIEQKKYQELTLIAPFVDVNNIFKNK